MRLLKAVKIRYPGLSLRQIRELIAAGKVSVNGKIAKERALAADGDDIAVLCVRQTALAPNADVACRLVKKTRDFVFLEKSAGVHSVAHGFDEVNSVANWLLSLDALAAFLGPLECGLAHRLDFETSGVMVAARNAPALECVRTLFHQRAVTKEYVCLVGDNPPVHGIYEAFAGKHAKSAKKIRVGTRGTEKTAILTEILAVEPQGDSWRLTLRLITGYRHQIRAHLAFLGCPIVGDGLYGGKEASRLMLHAERIAFSDHQGKTFEASSLPPF